MANTPTLGVPLIEGDQSQKHVTVNEALQVLDALAQVAVIDRDLAGPPGSPSEGDRYIIASGGTGDWAGEDGNIAVYQNGGWVFHAPAAGFVCFVADESLLLLRTASAWVPFNSSWLGVGATPDATNRLAVQSPAVLFNHSGDDSRVKVNKDAAGDTAAHLFQVGFSGRAEFGLLGNNNFTLKVSNDGSLWVDSFTVDASDGVVAILVGLDLSGLPTSSAGLPPGRAYIDVDTVKVA